MTEKRHAALAPSSLSFFAAASAGSRGDARPCTVFSWSSPRKRGSTTTLQLTANLRPDGFGAAIQILARVLDRARADRCRHGSLAPDHTAAELGLLSDPNPNPVGPGLLAFLRSGRQ